MKNKIIKIIKIIFGILILAGITSFFYLRSGTNNINITVEDLKNTLQPASKINNPTSNKHDKLAKYKVAKQDTFVNSPNYVAEQYNKICSKRDGEFIETPRVASQFKQKKRNDIQMNAYYAVNEKCNEWNEYWDTLSDKEKEDYKKNIKESREMELFFQKAAHNHDRSALELARSIISTGGDSSLFSTNVLTYLLKVDIEFKREIAKRMNVINPNLYALGITKKTSDIVGLYGCAVDPELGCNSDSIGILSLCSDFGLMCGKSFNQYILESTTANEYDDLQQIVNIIIRLIKEDFFDSK